MDSRVSGTVVGQKWRVTGFKNGETADETGTLYPARVGLEFWMEYEGEGSRRYGYEVRSFDPELARQMGYHLLDMADHAEGP